MEEGINLEIEHAAALLKAAGAREVFVFGSAATKSVRKDSDIDLAVSGLPPERFYQVMGRIACALKRPIDLVDLDEGSVFTEYLRAKGKLRRVV
jgi:predicted nucleotidyltransferase